MDISTAQPACPYIIDSGHHDRLKIRIFFGGGGSWCFAYYGMLKTLLGEIKSSSDPRISNTHITLVSGTSGGSQAAMLLANELNNGHDTAKAIENTLEKLELFYNDFAQRFSRVWNFGFYMTRTSATRFWQAAEHMMTGAIVDFDPMTLDLMETLERTGTKQPNRYDSTHVLINSSLLRDDSTDFEPVFHLDDKVNFETMAASCSLLKKFRGIRVPEGRLYDGGYLYNPVLKPCFDVFGISQKEAASQFNIVAHTEDPRRFKDTNIKPGFIHDEQLLNSELQCAHIDEMIDFCGQDSVNLVSMYNENRPRDLGPITKFVVAKKYMDEFARHGHGMGQESFAAMQEFVNPHSVRTLALV